MHLAHPQVIAGDEAIEDLRQEHAFPRAKAADDAEIDGHQISRPVDEQVSLVHVGMEEAVADGVAEEALDHRIAERHEVEALLLEAVDRGDGRTVDPLGGEHVPRRALPVDLGHAEAGIVPRVLRHFGECRCLHPQVELLLH